jgi:hypothetical protein
MVQLRWVGEVERRNGVSEIPITLIKIKPIKYIQETSFILERLVVMEESSSSLNEGIYQAAASF